MNLIERLDVYTEDAEDEHLSIVEEDGKYGVLDTNENLMIPFEYDNIFASMPGVMTGIQNGKSGVFAFIPDGVICTDCVYDMVKYHENYIVLENRKGVRVFLLGAGKLTDSMDYVADLNESYIEMYKDDTRTLIDTRDGEIICDDPRFEASDIFTTENGIVIYEIGEDECRLVFVDEYSDEIEEVYIDALLDVIYTPGINPVVETFIVGYEDKMAIIADDGRMLPEGQGEEIEIEISLSSGDSENMKIAGVKNYTLMFEDEEI